VTGRVSLVGAGPGDPGLLTRRAAVLLRRADLVLYDALIDARVLALAPRAQKFFVGKRAGRHALTQDGIHALMIRAARRGRRVVRLKGGDPFVFGRGGEEAMALEAAGIPVEVVPGISSAIAAPALAGIPVTHRGVASAFLVTTGHDLDAFNTQVSALAPAAATLVVLMGLGRAPQIAAVLLERRWPHGTPAAVVANASGARQRVWRGTLAQLAVRGADVGEAGDAATIVIGPTAALALACSAEAGKGDEHEESQRERVRR